MKTLSRHSDTAKAFAYLLKQWDGLNVYCSNGWVEIDNNIAENALRGVAVGRKNWLFAGSDSGGEHAAVLYSADRHMPSEQCGTRKMAALRH
ncbi:putative transposase [Escherichia coli]|nr:putative transposase [Escherichia coli]